MGLPPTSKLRFLDSDGTPIEAPAEWTPARLEICLDPTEWNHVHVQSQDEDLPVYLTRLRERTRILADWPRSGPGHYRVRLSWQNGVETQVVTIHPEKISHSDYAQIIIDLQTKLPATVVLALQNAGALSGIEFLDPGQSSLAQEVLRLKRAVKGTNKRLGLADLVPRIAKDPHQVLDTTHRWVRSEFARRPHPSNLAKSVASGQNLDEKGRLERVLDTRAEHSVDVYENRLLLLFIRQVDTRLRRLSRILAEANQASLRAETESLLSELNSSMRQAIFLEMVELPAHLPTQLTMVLLNRPLYNAVLQGYLEFHKTPSIRLEEPALDAPLENLPYLYQLWSTLELVTVLVDVAKDCGYEVEHQRFVQRDASGFFIRYLPNGDTILALRHPHHDTKIQVIPERSYSQSGQLHSISYTQRPDIAVEIRPADDTEIQILLFDPKYKLVDNDDMQDMTPEQGGGDQNGGNNRPKKPDIDKMHSYRDAIRDEDGNHVVRYAAILYPGPTVQYSSGLEALTSRPATRNRLRRHLEPLLQYFFF